MYEAMDDPYRPSALESELRAASPGPELARLLERVSTETLTELERIELICAQRRMVSHYQAQSYRQISAHRVSLEQSFPYEPELVAEQTELEVGIALHLSGRSAHLESVLAWGLERLPQVWETLDTGAIDLRRAEVLVDHLAHLPKEDRSYVLERVLSAAPTLTAGQLRHRVERLCLQANPEAAKLRYQEAVSDRRVESRPTPEGTADLLGYHLSPERVEAAYRHLTSLARKLRKRGESRTMDQLRADLLLDLLLGDEKAHLDGSGSVDLRVDLDTLAGLTEAPGELLGFGPVISDIARQVATRQRDSRWSWVVTDPETGLPLCQGITRRRPRRALRQAVEAKNPTCIFPGCRMPSQRCDLDHRQPWSEGGLTCEGNLVPLCRRHHLVRHRLGWRHRPLPRGDHLWTSPLGRRYTTSGQPP